MRPPTVLAFGNLYELFEAFADDTSLKENALTLQKGALFFSKLGKLIPSVVCAPKMLPKCQCQKPFELRSF